MLTSPVVGGLGDDGLVGEVCLMKSNDFERYISQNHANSIGKTVPVWVREGVLALKLCYNWLSMRNWSTDETKFDKESPEYFVWLLEHQINFGLAADERIDTQQLQKYLPILTLDPHKRKFIELLLYGSKPNQNINEHSA